MNESPGGRNLASRPNPVATVILVVGLIIASVSSSSSLPSEIASGAARTVGVALAIALGLELTQNWRAALRPDTLAFCALYFLTLFEFFFPQPEVNQMITRAPMIQAITLCLVAFGTMAVARHWTPPAPAWLNSLIQRPTSPNSLIVIFWLSLFVGYLYMLLAVDFNVGTLVDRMMGPRFSQPWGRGRYGDWKALLNELGMMINLVPPLGGLILAKRERYGLVNSVLVALAVLFVFFEGFASSTRNVLATYLVTFLIGYGINVSKKRLLGFLVFCCLAAAAFYQASSIMLITRTIGLKGYIEQQQSEKKTALKVVEEEPRTFYVDLNLINIAQLTEKFPRTHAFLGLEVPYIAAIHPIPRAIWHGKPEGLSLSIESALGEDEGITLSTTFVGEAYMAGGLWGVVLAGIFFGIVTGWWGRLVGVISSEIGFLIYASGFFAIVISMRSMFVFTTAILPTIAALVLTHIFLKIAKAPVVEPVKELPVEYEKN
jgi:hypothetical protein